MFAHFLTHIKRIPFSVVIKRGSSSHSRDGETEAQDWELARSLSAELEAKSSSRSVPSSCLLLILADIETMSQV